MADEPSLADRTMQLRTEATALASSDLLASLLSKTFDLLGQLQKEELDVPKLEYGLQSLDSECALVKIHDKIPPTPLRSMVYGLVETLNCTVDKMRREGRIRVKEQPPPVSAAVAATSPPPLDIAALLAAITAATAATATTETKRKIPDQNDLPEEGELLPEDAMEYEDIWGPREIKDEEMSIGDVMPALDDMRDGFDFENAEDNAIMNDLQDNEIISEDREKDSSETAGFENKKRPSRTVARPARFTQDSQPSAKKEKVKPSKRTMNLTFSDQKTTPQCLRCEAYPTTPLGYISHLQRKHKCNLSDIGMYLLCACGAKLRHGGALFKHIKECTRTECTLHKLADQ